MTASVPTREQVSVLIPAAGIGGRLGMGPKASLPLHGRPVIEWILDKATQVGAEVLVAIAPGCTLAAPATAVAGGATRQESIERLTAAATRPWCLLWDAANPFASVALARRVLAAAAGTGAAAACVPAVVPWLEIEGERVLRAHPAAGSGSISMPHAYATSLLREVTGRATRAGWVASSTIELMLMAGQEVTCVTGERLNIKLTTPEDWQLAQALLAQLQS
ncbi:2-C-methyl-D-erythritol 4-phosphate cytidylyltransferase [Ramlibacter sp. PS3R-8]|uniref:2-C-methyl-D-erythritol 4-phosphate cytidylyltransferase n=1 Tax=Ramlibacter sp. PS3R-8 TaxID=3133437 RepID=UPI0030AF312B